MQNVKTLAKMLIPVLAFIAEEMDCEAPKSPCTCKRDFSPRNRVNRPCECHTSREPKMPPMPISKNGLVEPVFKGVCGTMPTPKGCGCVMTDREPDGIKIQVDRPLRENFRTNSEFTLAKMRYNRLIDAAEDCDWPLRNPKELI